ncbi:hypothetical protein BH23ACT9_BH23ACT9_00110 [soil metagenome]
MLPADLYEMANRDCGLLSRRELLRAGYNDEAIYLWRAAGFLEAVLPGHYRIVGAPVPAWQGVRSVSKYLEPKVQPRHPVMTKRAGLAALEVPGFVLPTRVTALIQRGSRVRIEGAPFDVIQTRLEVVDRLRVRDVWIAAPARLLADLALDATDLVLIDAVDAVRNHCRVTQMDLIRHWQSVVHSGARRLLQMAALGVFDVESGGERNALQLLFADNPPAPDCQVQITDRYRADFAYIFAGLVLEYYGEAAHAGRVDADGLRIGGVRLPGWDAFVLTKSMMRSPGPLGEQIHELRREREAAMLAGILRRPALPRQPDRRVPLRTLVPLG